VHFVACVAGVNGKGVGERKKKEENWGEWEERRRTPAESRHFFMGAKF